MPHLPPVLTDVVALLSLVGLLLTAWRHPTPRAEATAAAGAIAVVLLTGTTSGPAARDALERLAPVVIFLAAILVVAEVCGRAGLFTVAAGVVRRWGRGHPARHLVGVAVLATLVTTVLSLDATVVLLTPVVVASAVGFEGRAGAWLCLRLANSASLLLPVANLTNLLAMPDLPLTFAQFAWAMAPVLVVVVAAEWALTRWLVPIRTEVARAPEPVSQITWFPLITVAVMLVGFAALSPFHVEPAWVAVVAAVVLTIWSARRGVLSAGRALRSAQPSFALYVLALGVVVAGVAQTSAGDLLADLTDRIDGTGLLALLAIAGLATITANLVTNLSATLLIVPLVAPLGPVAVLAALLGLDIGAGLTYSGSLANLLWRRTQSDPPTLSEFHRRSLLATPVVLVLAVVVLWAWSGMIPA